MPADYAEGRNLVFPKNASVASSLGHEQFKIKQNNQSRLGAVVRGAQSSYRSVARCTWRLRSGALKETSDENNKNQAGKDAQMVSGTTASA